MAVGGAKDSIVFPPQLASTSPMGTVPSKCRYSLSQTKHKTRRQSTPPYKDQNRDNKL